MDSLWQSLWVWRTSGWLKLLRSWEGQKLIIFTSVASVIIHHIHHIHHEKTFSFDTFPLIFFPTQVPSITELETQSTNTKNTIGNTIGNMTFS